MTRLMAIVCAAVLAGIGTPGQSSDCPELNLPADSQQTYCEQFRELLYGPFRSGSDRDANPPGKTIESILTSDPLWGEVYRADPKKTLELIARIRDAGGLQQY